MIFLDTQKHGMKSLFGLLFLSLFCFTSCKKDDEIIEIEEEIYNPNVAPCEIAELNYHLDSVFYGPSNFFPQAKFRVKFVDTLPYPLGVQEIYSVEFAFNKVPTTGMYHMMYKIDTNDVNFPNQISYLRDSIGMHYYSNYSQTAEVFVENNDNELIISYCNISNYTAMVDLGCNCYIGNTMRNVKAVLKY